MFNNKYIMTEEQATTIRETVVKGDKIGDAILALMTDARTWRIKSSCKSSLITGLTVAAVLIIGHKLKNRRSKS